ncbi:MAG TPA: serine hydrolase domain-containing protein [Longimicrobium sp.]|nr:serine hydrolase domain-containing protein [Longimicrobium sp.]
MLKRMLAIAAALPCAATPAHSQAPAPGLDSLITAYAREHGFNGTVLVQDGGRIRLHRSFGLAERAFRTPADTATRYRVASITKLFTSVLVLQLVQEGKLALQTPIHAYLPDYPGAGADRITIHQLLNHTSGIANFDREVTSFQQAIENGIEQYQKPHTTDALLRRCCSGPLVSQPGAAFSYNNSDYIVLGKIIERVTGKRFGEVLSERILRPLGLRNTGMLRQDTVMEGLASTYFFRDDTRTLINDLPVYIENWYAAGGMYSTTSDLLTFANALFGSERLLNTQMRGRLLAPGLDDYGYGLWSYTFRRNGREYRVAKRPGSIMGANAVLYRLADFDTTIVLLANTNQADLDVFAQRIANHFVDRRAAAGR